MYEPSTTRDPGLTKSDTIQTVGELEQWLKGFPDHHSVLGTIQGHPRVNWVQCRHAEGHVIIEVPLLKPRS